MQRDLEYKHLEQLIDADDEAAKLAAPEDG